MNLEEKESVNSIKSVKSANKLFWGYHFVILLVSALFSGLLTFLSPQTYGFQYFILFTSIFLLLISIFVLTLPKINPGVISRLTDKKILTYSILIFLLVFPLLNWIYVENLGESVKFFVIWYLIPVGILLFPLIISQNPPKQNKKSLFHRIMHIVGVIYLAIGFDNRYTYKVVSGLDDIGYNFNALWVSTLILVIFSMQIDDFGDKFSWNLTWKNLRLSLIILSILSILILPAALFSGFIRWNPAFNSFGMQPLIFLGIWFTIALPEELIARGVIQHQASKISRINHKKAITWQLVIIILIASFIFGLSHWNNTAAEFVWYYISFATIAGIGYGICWYYGGLLPAMLAHTLVDWLWQFLFAS